MCYKITVLKSFAKFTQKNLRGRFFLIELQVSNSSYWSLKNISLNGTGAMKIKTEYIEKEIFLLTYLISKFISRKIETMKYSSIAVSLVSS